jgi:hypothetical protein
MYNDYLCLMCGVCVVSLLVNFEISLVKGRVFVNSGNSHVDHYVFVPSLNGGVE